ncbi:MAG: RNA polymerase factor sigma-54, partial [Planctomycetota bacterium]|nr:RNA polymerase factor sigma-54 [Planctomycetota bacterium]
MARYDVRPAQTQRAEQRMVMQPRMLQGLEMLALPALELTAFLAEKALENEALLVEEAGEEPRRRDETDWRPKSVAREALERRDEVLDGIRERDKTTAERALEQVALLDLTGELGAWARFMVTCLDENGWLSATDAELLGLAHAAGLEPSHDLLARAIACVQGLDPRGIGGRNAIEALLLQLDTNDPDYLLSCRVIEEFLDDLSRNKRPAVAKALGIDARKLDEVIAGLSTLDPCPGRSLASSAAQVIHPDVVVERTDAGFDVRVERSSLPKVSLDPVVVRTAADKSEPREVRAWLRGKVEEARWLVAALDDRRATLLRVARSACHHQRAFLEHGDGRLTPLSLTTVAEELGLSLSTVSRAVADKYVETPFGCVLLRRFFQAAAGGGEGTVIEDVRVVVRELFEGEDARAPISDEDAVEVLRGKGIELSRRSVAKHRAALGIASSYLRKRHG